MSLALITGASKGIGKAIAEELASRNYDLLLIARSEELLSGVADLLKEKYRIQVDYLALDLSLAGAALRALTWCQEKKYSIGIQDIWFIPQKDIDYLRSRAKYASDFLKDTKFETDSKFLMDRITANLDGIDASQEVQKPILEHISAYRSNMATYNDTEKDVENLEKLLAAFREDLEKSKVENVLQKIQSLKGVGDVSKVMFNKKFESSTAWSFIGWVLLFVGLLTLINFVVWLLRSKDKKITNVPPSAPPEKSTKE